jgi:hypothetical protein
VERAAAAAHAVAAVADWEMGRPAVRRAPAAGAALVDVAERAGGAMKVDEEEVKAEAKTGVHEWDSPGNRLDIVPLRMPAAAPAAPEATALAHLSIGCCRGPKEAVPRPQISPCFELNSPRIVTDAHSASTWLVGRAELMLQRCGVGDAALVRGYLSTGLSVVGFPSTGLT